ncbi:Hypothetical_protein [Hexamita inflata]|uniref:Hypothetical_protein n=1 Tax=Hexamita inflata TaxID=28002 RepID=A0AA86USA6_9EUKA|nr:Hypothetical protein HINF_LOCUS50582 [Hexamita inflata]
MVEVVFENFVNYLRSGNTDKLNIISFQQNQQHKINLSTQLIFYRILTKTVVQIISTVFSFALLVSIILFIVFKRRKQKQMNQIEFKIKNKRKLTEQNINLIIEDNFKETKVQTKKNVQISTANTTKNELVILDEIENMNQILKEIEIKQIDEIKENDVYLYKE